MRAPEFGVKKCDDPVKKESNLSIQFPLPVFYPSLTKFLYILLSESPIFAKET
jgi:hypothetical protein